MQPKYFLRLKNYKYFMTIAYLKINPPDVNELIARINETDYLTAKNVREYCHGSG